MNKPAEKKACCFPGNANCLKQVVQVFKKQKKKKEKKTVCYDSNELWPLMNTR